VERDGRGQLKSRVGLSVGGGRDTETVNRFSATGTVELVIVIPDIFFFCL
jgi:hypothetical protein